MNFLTGKFNIFKMKLYSELKYGTKKLLSKIDEVLFINYFKVLAVLLFIVYIFLFVRLLRYGIPVELIEFKNVILLSQSYFFGNLFSVILFIFIITFTTVSALMKFIEGKFFSLPFFYMILLIISIFLEESFTPGLMNDIFDWIIFFSCVIFILNFLTIYKNYKLYIKSGILLAIMILLFSITMESMYQVRYSTMKNNEHFQEDNIFSQVTYDYIKQYREPFIAEIKIDETIKETSLVLGVNNRYFYYYPNSSIREILLELEKENKKLYEKICVSSNKKEYLYPYRMIELLKTSKLLKRKYERKKINRIKIVTEYKSFYASFCRK